MHFLLDASMSILGEKMFDPNIDQAAQSIHFIEGNYIGRIYAISVCNKHDTWIASTVI